MYSLILGDFKMSKTLDKPMKDISFRSMSFLFNLRDLFIDPMKKVKKAKVTLGDTVLDYGCGTGSYSIAAGKIVGPSGKVYAADIQPLSAKKVQHQAQKNKLDNISTIVTNCETQLPKNSIDKIICFDMFHMVKEPLKILAEFHRVLKPTGLLSLDCHHLNDIEPKVVGSGLFKLAKRVKNTFNFIKSD